MNNKQWIDFSGRVYSSLSAMCATYNINVSTYKSRLAKGMSQEQALTTKLGGNSHPCQDHLGNYFETRTAMCYHYGIDAGIFRSRLKAGWSLQRILETPIRSKRARREH